MSVSEMDDVIKEFLVESHESLDRLDRDFVELEEHPTDSKTLASVFRTIHTIKGTTGFLGFGKLERVAHVGENLLSMLRDGVLLLNPEITTALLALVDAVRQMLGTIEADGTDGQEDYEPLVQQLSLLQKDKSKPSLAPVARVTVQVGAASDEPRPIGSTLIPVPALPVAAVAEVPIAPAIPTVQQLPVPVVPPPRVTEAIAAVPVSPPGNVFRAPLPVVAKPVESLDYAKDAAPMTEVPRDSVPRMADSSPRTVGEGGESRSIVSDSSIRVDVRLLDKLMNLVGELVLARNQILESATRLQDVVGLAASQRLNLITTELQEGVMKTRMQPIGNVWGKFPRIVRDLALACNKQARIEMEGAETELDRTIIEAIKDPLTHLVRNAIDHGIEQPSARVMKGKSAEGRLSMRAYHEGSQVNIEITDDGAGMNVDRIRDKALQKGLVSPEQLAHMSERDMMNLVFLPGLSTAEKVSNVSGRGVGMDVVRTNIEKIGGTVDIQTVVGRGTSFKIKIPLTLAIIPALVISCAGDRFAIPQVSLLKLVRLDGEQAKTGIEYIHGVPVFRLRGNLLPIVSLREVLDLQTDTPQETDAQEGSTSELEQGESVNIIVLQAGDCRFGLLVDDVIDTQETVVKPLSKHLKGLETFAGATIMGDGRVALILDVLGLAQKAGLLSGLASQSLIEASLAAQKATGPKELFLLVQSGDGGNMAIPLSLVARLEEFPRASVELAGLQEVVQYRGQIMQLVNISKVLPDRRKRARGKVAAGEAEEKIRVVVHTRGGRSIGFVVAKIVDIVEDTLSAKRPPSRNGVLFSAVIQNRVTEFLDVMGIIRNAEPGFLEDAAFGQGGE